MSLQLPKYFSVRILLTFLKDSMFIYFFCQKIFIAEVAVFCFFTLSIRKSDEFRILQECLQNSDQKSRWYVIFIHFFRCQRLHGFQWNCSSFAKRIRRFPDDSEYQSCFCYDSNPFQRIFCKNLLCCRQIGIWKSEFFIFKFVFDSTCCQKYHGCQTEMDWNRQARRNI